MLKQGIRLPRFTYLKLACLFSFPYKKMIHDNLRIRALFMPLLDTRNKCFHDLYLHSSDSWYLKTLKGIHTGEWCFIIGNGSSLCPEDLDKLKEEYTFASNRIYEIFSYTDWRPSYYMAEDPDFLKENYSRLYQYDLDHMFLAAREKETFGQLVNKITRIFNRRLQFRKYRLQT